MVFVGVVRRFLIGVVFCVVLLSPEVLAGGAAAQATPCADLQIADITVTPTSPVAGQPASVSVTIRNAGTCAAGGFVTQFKSDLFAPTGPSDSLSGLAAGASTTLTLPFNFPTAGNFQTVVQVDTGNAVDETNEVNNLEIKSVTVQPATVNLSISSFAIAPGPTGAVVQGRSATATIRVTNSGNAPAGPFQVQWTPFVFAQPVTRTVNTLDPGASVDVTMDFTFPFAGTVTGTAVVDPANQVAETNEFDNTAFLQTVVEPPLPNLAMADNGIQVHATPAGSTSHLDVTVTNNGNDPAGDFVVSWQPWFLATPLSQQVNGLAVGQSKTVGFDYVFPFASTFNGTVTVDSTDAVAEVSETDNTAPTQFIVPAATVDLTITDLTIDPSSPTQGAPATATVRVQNQGNSPSGSFVTDWNPDAFGLIVPSVQTLSKQTGPLAPGATRDITFSFTYPQAGNFRSIANVDSFNQVQETNEANNQKILNITVQPAPIDLVFTGPIQFNPAQPVRGNNATATVTVRNNGPIATGPFAVELVQQQNGFPAFQFLNGLNPGETRTLTFTVNYSSNGTFTATATIDPFNQVVEPGPGAKANNTLNQTVTIIPPSATLNVTLDHLHALNSMEFSSCVPIVGNPFDCGSGEWDNIVFVVFDPNSSCNLNIDAGVVQIHQTVPSISCRSASDDSVNAGDDVGIHQTIPVTLVDQTPLVAAVGALESDFQIPDVPGAAFFLSFRPDYLHLSGLQQVAGVGCSRISGFPNIGQVTTVDNGHCFDAFFGVSVVNVVGSAARDRAAADGRGRVARAAKPSKAATAAAKRVAASRRRYVRSMFTRLRASMIAVARRAHVRAGSVRVTARTSRKVSR
jgi:subtilase family serine protease